MLPKLGDFDSLEYAQALVAGWPQLEAAGINVLAIGIGDGTRLCRCHRATGFPSEQLRVDAEPQLHRALGLYEGLWQIGGPWPNLPPIQGPFFARAGGLGFLRPFVFELATVRLLSNMSEVLGHSTGAPTCPEADDTLVYCYRDRGILGFFETMSRPLSFLDPFLG